jgi:hypothetical protein
MAGPYELQSPKDIAMEYGGNKQKIAQAAQMGMIDPTSAVLAGMFIDKMRMAQQEEMAPQSTVAQDVMATPQMAAGLGATPQAAMAPQMAPTEAGVAALPVPEDMVADAYAGGGIVAFQGGGMPIDYTQFGELGEELKRQEELRRLFLGENEALKAEREGMKSARDEQRNMRLIEAGLGIAGGESQYALQNIAKGALPAIKGYGEDVATQRKRETELAGMERAERAKVLESAMGTSMAREKLTPETIRAAREIQEEARQNKKPVPSLAEAIKSIERTSGTATLQSAFVNARTNAAKAVGELVNSQTFKQEVKAIEKKQGREAAEAYKRQKIRETVGLFPGVNIDEVMSVVGGSGASAAPSKSSGTVDKNNPLLR